jgi:apolipoprotein N-acyltransferase
VLAGVPICYELLFPDLVRRFVRDGAELLLAITNDAWYGHTGAPFQFLAITALRSAETGVWTARAANTGVSAIIDGRGRVRSRTRIFERAWLVADLPRRAPGAETFYVRHGDWLAAACWALVAALAVRGTLGMRRSHG